MILLFYKFLRSLELKTLISINLDIINWDRYTDAPLISFFLTLIAHVSVGYIPNWGETAFLWLKTRV